MSRTWTTIARSGPLGLAFAAALLATGCATAPDPAGTGTETADSGYQWNPAECWLAGAMSWVPAAALQKAGCE